MSRFGGWFLNRFIQAVKKISAAAGIILLLQGPAQAAFVDQMEANYIARPDDVELGIKITNDDPGAIYDSGTLNVLQTLDDHLWGLSANQNNYSSKEDMVNDWGVSIRSDPTGEVYNGWANLLQNDGSVLIGHTSGGSYDQWLSTYENDASDMMALTISIPKSQLETDGIAGYNPNSDARIKLSTKTIDDAFVANTGSPAQGQEYAVVPEPSSLALVGEGLQLDLRYTASGNYGDPVDEILVKADGVTDVYCSDANHPDWQGLRFTPADQLDVDGDGVYDRGVILFSDANTLEPGEHLDFEIDSSYADNLDEGIAAFCIAATGEKTTSSCQVPTCNLPCDIDKDGLVDIHDLYLLSEAWLDATVNPDADINADGGVDLKDLAEMSKHWQQDPAGGI